MKNSSYNDRSSASSGEEKIAERSVLELCGFEGGERVRLRPREGVRETLRVLDWSRGRSVLNSSRRA
ncbi:hypothetical protein E2C01_001803 [Portunus trituberculatus]|uniref:Uncharacterized protein n=1 Tax=Portunus trituberculatus TaxID=210409 RepID=A0A5B7CII5_PORTR|nr:hypothetical protein [Portunus trituberculatus]